MTSYKDAQASRDTGAYELPVDSGDERLAIRRKLQAAIKLLALFCSVYFVAALIATPEFKHIANIQFLNLPLGFYTGILVFVVGIAVTRMCLNQDQKS